MSTEYFRDGSVELVGREDPSRTVTLAADMSDGEKRAAIEAFHAPPARGARKALQWLKLTFGSPT